VAVALGHAQQKGSALQEAIVAQERSELDSLKSGDLAAFASFVAEDAVFVDASGSASKADVVKNVANFRLHEYAMSDIRFVPLSADEGLIVYRIAESGTSHGKEFTLNVNVSALWVKRAAKWVCVFSQETTAK